FKSACTSRSGARMQVGRRNSTAFPSKVSARLRQFDLLVLEGCSRKQALDILGVSTSTFCRWLMMSGRFKFDDEMCLARLELENAELQAKIAELRADTTSLRTRLKAVQNAP